VFSPRGGPLRKFPGAPVGGPPVPGEVGSYLSQG
jgi:hypothetical protein